MRRLPVLLSSLLLVVLGGCSRTQVASGPVALKAPATQAAAAAAPDEAGFVAILANADALDGSVDRTVSKCAGCSLAMAGHPENAVTAHGYSLQFCSADCKKLSEPKIDTVIAALK